MKMPAVVNYGPRAYSVELREIDRPAFDDEDVLLKVAVVSVCGSDLHQWTGEHTWPKGRWKTCGVKKTSKAMRSACATGRLARE